MVTGTNVTISNGPDKHYNPTTTFSGTKVWRDDGDIRPDSITVILYKGEGAAKTEVARTTVSGGGNSWTYNFTNVPVFDENGSVIQYYVEEILPDGSAGKYMTTSETVTQISYNRDHANDKVDIYTPNNVKTISAGVNLGFVVVKHGNDFFIWTPRKATPTELNLIKSKSHGAAAGNNDFSSIEDFGFTEYYGTPCNDIKKGNMRASIYMDGDVAKIDFGNKNWSSVAMGQLAYTYDPGVMNLINTQTVSDFNFHKLWKNSQGSGYEVWEDGKEIEITLKRRDTSQQNKPVDAGFSLKYKISKVNGEIVATLTEKKPSELDSDTFALSLASDVDHHYLFRTGQVLERADNSGKVWEYFVQEAQPEMYKDPAYAFGEEIITKVNGEDSDKAMKGEYIINTPYDAVELPHTGGTGTRFFMILGSILTLGAGILLWERRRMI